MLDALDGAERIFRVELRAVGEGPLDVHLRVVVAAEAHAHGSGFRIP